MTLYRNLRSGEHGEEEERSEAEMKLRESRRVMVGVGGNY